jgi:dsDNA-specific endonuclease/ATPase MutS2
MRAQFDHSLALELEFDKILELIAAHARTRVGRVVVRELADVPDGVSERVRSALLTRAVVDLIEEDGPLALAGVDEAVPWLEDDAPPPSEPRDLVALLTLARRIAAVRRRLDASGKTEFEEILDRLADTTELVARVAPKLKRDGTVADNASSELGRLRREIARGCDRCASNDAARPLLLARKILGSFPA